MNPNFPPPQPDPNSSSLAYLNHLPPGTQPHYLPVQGNPPRLRNAPVPDRALLNPQQDQMDIATGDDTSSPARDASPDHEPGRGLKRARPDTSDTETLEHSEPVCKQRRTEPPEPVREESVAASISMFITAKLNMLEEVVTRGDLDRLQTLVTQIDHIEKFFDDYFWRIAVRQGHLAVIEWLHHQADRFNIPRPESSGLMFEAINHGQLHIVQWLVRQGGDIHLRNYDDDNVLTLAARAGHLEVVKWLASQGCNIHHLNAGNDNAVTLAAAAGHLDVVKWLVSQGCNIHQIDNDQENALTLAAAAGHLEVVKWLAGQGCNIHQVNYEEDNALTLAASAGHLEIIKWLYEQGCNIHQVTDNEDNLLTLAAAAGHLEIVKWLASQGCNIHQVNDNKNHALHHAASGGHLEVIQWLFEKGCNIHQVDNYKNNALTLAASRGHLEVIQWFADQGCNIRQINNYGDNALTRALSNVDVNECGLDLVQYLLGKGCDIDHQNEYGRTALFFAMNGQKIDIACHLITQGANVHIGFPPESGGSLFTALNIENPALINLLIPLHDLSRRSANGSTPLMIAAEENLIEVAVPLIQATAKLSAGLKLIGEAFSVATGLLFKELLSNVFFTGDGPLPHSDLWANSGPTFMSGVIYQYVCSQYSELPYLQASLGSAGTMTTAQIKAAKVGVLAELPAWKLHHPVESLFNEELPPTLLSVRKKIITFINDDIEVLATQALQWEEDHLIPVVENLYASCLSHSLSAQAAIDIISELTGKGLYYPIAQKMANAWVTVWTSVSADAAPILRPSAPTHIEDWDFEDLTDLDPLTGDVAANSNTIARNIDNFVGTPVGSALLEAFRAALRREFDSVGGGILRVEGANLSEQSKALYADLIARQLHLIAQFWRAES